MSWNPVPIDNFGKGSYTWQLFQTEKEKWTSLETPWQHKGHLKWSQGKDLRSKWNEVRRITKAHWQESTRVRTQCGSGVGLCTEAKLSGVRVKPGGRVLGTQYILSKWKSSPLSTILSLFIDQKDSQITQEDHFSVHIGVASEDVLSVLEWGQYLQAWWAQVTLLTWSQAWVEDQEGDHCLAGWSLTVKQRVEDNPRC